MNPRPASPMFAHLHFGPTHTKVVMHQKAERQALAAVLAAPGLGSWQQRQAHGEELTWLGRKRGRHVVVAMRAAASALCSLRSISTLQCMAAAAAASAPPPDLDDSDAELDITTRRSALPAAAAAAGLVDAWQGLLGSAGCCPCRCAHAASKASSQNCRMHTKLLVGACLCPCVIVAVP